MKNNHEQLENSVLNKTRVRKQNKRLVSAKTGTLSRELKKQEIAMKRKKIGVRVRVKKI